MSLVVNTSSRPHGHRSTPLAPGATAIVPNPLGHRVRIRHRLATNVFLADRVASETTSTDSFPSPPQLVLKIGRLLRPWEPPTASLLLSTDGGAWQELRVARQLLATAGHSHVVRTLECHVENRLSYLLLEYCTDGDLFAHVTRAPRGCLPPRDALQKLRQIASGLAFLHGHNIAHRDLSLENVLLHDGECKICDFGLSARANARTNDVVGKTAYAAPEVVQGEWYDPVRADLWSLGVLLFMMLTGSPLVPFASPSCAEFKAFKAVGVRGVLRAWGLETQFSAATVDLLTRLLEIRPDHRIASAREVLRHPAMLAAALHHTRDLTQL